MGTVSGEATGPQNIPCKGPKKLDLTTHKDDKRHM